MPAFTLGSGECSLLLWIADNERKLAYQCTENEKRLSKQWWKNSGDYGYNSCFTSIIITIKKMA